MITRSARRAISVAISTLFVLAAALVGAAPASAATTTPALVPGAPSIVTGFAEYNGLLYLGGVAEGDTYTSLFSYDGTTFTHIAGSPQGVTDLVAFDGKLVITAVDDILNPPFDYIIYTYDGSSFAQFGGGFTSPNEYVEAGGVLFFQAYAGGTWNLWQFDGVTTSAVPGGGVAPEYLSAYGGKVYFGGDTDPTPAEDFRLFSYDPSTPLVAAAPVAGSPSDPGPLVAFDGVAYLPAGGTMYTFDGATTFTPVALGSAVSPFGLTVIAGVLYFSGELAGDFSPYSLVGSVATLVPGGIHTETSDYHEFNGDIFFLGFDGVGGTATLSVIHSGVASYVTGGPTYAFHFITYNGKLYFTADQSTSIANAMYVLEARNSLASTGTSPWMPGLLAMALLGAGATALIASRARRGLAE